jgi:hypothetical protein
MCQVHTERPDSHVEFSTPNYGLQTTPAKKWELVFEGCIWCGEVEGKEGRVSVMGTRGCCKASGLKWLNTGNTDPTTLGLKWQVVVDTHPTEARQLTNAMMADALASKTAEEEEHQLTKVVDLKKDDLDKFGITDLCSTDFIEAGGSYFKLITSTVENIFINFILLHSKVECKYNRLSACWASERVSFSPLSFSPVHRPCCSRCRHRVSIACTPSRTLRLETAAAADLRGDAVNPCRCERAVHGHARTERADAVDARQHRLDNETEVWTFTYETMTVDGSTPGQINRYYRVLYLICAGHVTV